MKKLILSVSLMACCICLCFTIYSNAKNIQELYAMVHTIHWLGHDCFKIENDVIIYTDPFTIKKQDKADIILISHEHFDHCSPDDVKKLLTNNTIVVAPSNCVLKLPGTVKTLEPGNTLTIKDISIEAVPAYNTNKNFHPKEKKWVGYIITINKIRIYFAGDTDYIPEMKTFKNIDIALLPVSGTYVMNAEEAVKAALDIQPKVAIPMHYGSIVGSIDDAKKFEHMLKGKIKVVIKELENY